MKILVAILFVAGFPAAAQIPQVPHKMQFAGMTLTIRDDARREIQKDVDALSQSPKHFNIKAERAKTYFPIIEKVFEEERVPDDFKYLVLQESALIADAVSSSKAVGFWQFKDYTALEMGMRVDKEVDERMNIVSASRGAARYIKKNNFFFNNWLYALQAYQMGAGAVLQTVKEPESGTKHMEITSQTYWYVKKFLAHKVAYEDAVKGSGQLQVLAYENQTRKTLTDLAKEVSVDENELKNLNKWAKSGVIPDDKTYAVLIPVTGSTKDMSTASLGMTGTAALVDLKNGHEARAVPSMVAKESKIKINGVFALVAISGESPAQLAARGGVDLSDFLKWNEISISDHITLGAYYFLAKKRARASEPYHKVSSGENLWLISQQYGVQMKRLKKYNKLNDANELPVGTTLWLSSTKPKDAKNFTPDQNVLEVDNNQTFSWSVASEESSSSIKPLIVSASASEESSKVAETTDSTKNLQPKEETLQPSDSASTITVSPSTVDKTEHTVQAGETLYAIASLYKIGVMDLVEWNNLKLADGIKPGQVLKLSGNQPVEDTVVVVNEPKEVQHEVQPTDTLYSVARKYGVTIKELMDWNDKKDFSLTVGEKLKILKR